MLPLSSNGPGSGYFFADLVQNAVGFVNDHGIVELAATINSPNHLAWMDPSLGTVLVSSLNSGKIYLLTPQTLSSTATATR